MNNHEIFAKKYSIAFMVAMPDEAISLLLQDEELGTVLADELNNGLTGDKSAEAIVESFAVNINGVKYIAIKLPCIFKEKSFLVECLVCITGIGKENAVHATTQTLLFADFDLMINYGSCGSAQRNYEVGRVYIADYVSFGDVDLRAFNYDFGQLPREPFEYALSPKFSERIFNFALQHTNNINIGRIISTDSFISDKKQADAIKSLIAAADERNVRENLYYYCSHLADLQISTDDESVRNLRREFGENHEMIRKHLIDANYNELGNDSQRGALVDKLVTEFQLERRKYSTSEILGFDMEAAAIGMICKRHKKSLLVLKEVSDGADDNAADSFKDSVYHGYPLSNLVNIVINCLPLIYVSISNFRKKTNGN